MLKRQIVLAMASVMLAAATFGQDTDERPLLERIDELTKVPLSVEVAQQWLKAADEAANDEIRQNMLMAAATAFIHSRDLDAYKKKVQPLLANVKRFEESLQQYCENCSGRGNIEQQCKVCNGSGRCSANGCDYGYVKYVVKQKVNTGKNTEGTKEKWKKCQRCNGTGRCNNCDGNGYLRIDCKKCQGNGWVVRAEKVKEAYHYFASEVNKQEQYEERMRRDEEQIRKEQEQWEKREKEYEAQRKRDEEQRKMDELMQERGLVKMGGKWMPEDSKQNADFFIKQKLLVLDNVGKRAPTSDEHGGLLCLDKKGNTFCLIVSYDEYNTKFPENENRRCDLYRCGSYSCRDDKNPKRNIIVPLYATDCETALDETKTGKHGRALVIRDEPKKKKWLFWK